MIYDALVPLIITLGSVSSVISIFKGIVHGS